MCSYATVNGVYACQSRYLMTNKLDQEWDFPGFVTSDYGALHSTRAAPAAGSTGAAVQHLLRQPLLDAVLGGAIPQPVLNTMVQRMLTEMFRSGCSRIRHREPVLAGYHAGPSATGTQVAEAGRRCCKNNNGTLPLPVKNGGTVAVIGRRLRPLRYTVAEVARTSSRRRP